MSFQPRIVAAILRKDVACLYPVVLLATAIFAGDVFITKLELLPLWASFRMPLVLLSSTLLIISVFQLDAPVSLVDDWLCRPVPRRELLAAKLLLVIGVIYFSRVVATFIADLLAGYAPMESLLEAVLLQDVFFLLLLPVLLMTAVITTTLVQGIGVLIALFVVVFMIPTALIQAPGPLQPAIGDAISENGMGWMAVAPAKLVPLLLVGLCYWLVYWRKQVTGARVLLVASTSLTLLFVVLPMWLLPWEVVRSVQAATLGGDEAADPAILQRISLHNPRACFPATRVGALNSDAAFNAVRQFRGLNMWSDEDLRDSGPESLTFLTSIEPRGLPPDWRVKLNYVQAEYRSSDGSAAFALRPPRYITDQGNAGALSHAWVLPERALAALTAAGDPALKLTYSLALLEPQPYRVPTDGRRHRLPGLGYCSATIDALNNQIEVDCFSTGAGIAQLSAELAEIQPSRVETVRDFSPTWVRLPRSYRFKLQIASPRLSAHDYITVTAWKTAAFMDKTWSGTGILGDASEQCPLPSPERNDTQQMSRWRDAAAHETLHVSVDQGVQLEILDFGGQGTPMLLVPGLGATAHSFDTLAPALAKKYRVFAMTRRGSGASSRVDFGYGTARLAQDVVAVLDALELPKAILVGASIAGDELTWLGGHHAQRIRGLVYLDAAYDRSRKRPVPRARELNARLPPEPPTREQDMRDYESFKALQDRRDGVHIPEGELIAFYNAGNPYLAGVPNIDMRIAEAIDAAIGKPDYAALQVPALALYATPGESSGLKPWYDRNDKQLMADLAELGPLAVAQQRASIELFRNGVVNGKVVELPGANHWIFISNEADVLREIDSFIAGLPRE